MLRGGGSGRPRAGAGRPAAGEPVSAGPRPGGISGERPRLAEGPGWGGGDRSVRALWQEPGNEGDGSEGRQRGRDGGLGGPGAPAGAACPGAGEGAAPGPPGPCPDPFPSRCSRSVPADFPPSAAVRLEPETGIKCLFVSSGFFAFFLLFLIFF